MTLEERIKLQLGELIFSNHLQAIEIERLTKELEAKNKEDSQ